ncbi:hypothetical protein GCM10009093_17650 [Brevundimonas terrae]|uniref:Fimbrial protein n=1 Tax=Brevundimonas terrae TaxID=363631 RepID=A0ABN0YD32_9CAUL|nr:hypothetical protein [Brevundimonas terrae]NIJ26503.1 hypothetical protein [Brevundimonas terrae]
MKVSALLSAAAVAALIASPAAAGSINQGEWFSHLFQTHVDSPPFAGANLIDAQTAGSPWSAWHSVGASVGNNGTAAGNDGATFTLKGNVTKDCSFYSGSSTNQTLDFGTLGIYASDNTGPAAAFDMVAPANVTVYTNLAGCNTANSVTITKNSADGLINAGNTGGYDSNVFQANLPFSVEAKYTAAAHNSVANGSQQTLSVSSTALSNVANHGAWKSPFSLAVNIPVASKALLAGNYEGTVAVQIQAF